MKTFNVSFLLAGALVVGTAICLPAKALTINTINRGYYDSSGATEVNPAAVLYDNYTALSDPNPGSLSLRNFFIFDLSGISTPFATAELQLFTPSNGYFANINVNYTISSVSTPVNDLIARSATGVGVYNSLGNGTPYGNVLLTPAVRGNYVNIPLNAAAIAALNANLGGQIAFGGSLDPTPVYQFAFGFSNTGNAADGRTRLAYTAVPVPPATASIVLSIVLATAGKLRRKGVG